MLLFVYPSVCPYIYSIVCLSVYLTFTPPSHAFIHSTVFSIDSRPLQPLPPIPPHPTSYHITSNDEVVLTQNLRMFLRNFLFLHKSYVSFMLARLDIIDQNRTKQNRTDHIEILLEHLTIEVAVQYNRAD